jgi:hypothetical protein
MSGDLVGLDLNPPSFRAHKDGTDLIPGTGGSDGVVFNQDVVGPSPNVKAVRRLRGTSVVFDEVLPKGIPVASVLLRFVPKVDSMPGILVNMVVEEQIVGVLMPNGDAKPFVGIRDIILKNPVLDPPAEEKAVLLVVMADVVFDGGVV